MAGPLRRANGHEDIEDKSHAAQSLFIILVVAAEGLRFAPAYDGGALNPAVMPLSVALIGAIVLREKLSATQKLGLLFILVSAVLMIGWHTETHGTTWDTSRTFGDTLFLLAAFLTAIFTVPPYPVSAGWVGLFLICSRGADILRRS